MMLYHTNDTEAFIREKFGEEHFQWIRKHARELDQMGWEAAQRETLVSAAVKEAEDHQKQEQAKRMKCDKITRELEDTQLILDLLEVEKLNGEQVILQINKHHSLGEDELILSWTKA
jgi:hypothetical protein